MAFVNHIPVVPSSSSKIASTCSTPVMVAGDRRIGRRAVLKLSAVFAGLSVAEAAFAQIDSAELKELKEDVEEIKYEEEVTEVGPDPRAENITRTKKKEPEPEFRKEEKELLAAEEKEYDAMVAREAAEAAEIKAKFSKK